MAGLLLLKRNQPRRSVNLLDAATLALENTVNNLLVCSRRKAPHDITPLAELLAESVQEEPPTHRKD